MLDGSRLRQSWADALNTAETHFRTLIASPSSEWRHVPSPKISTDSTSSSTRKGKSRISPFPDINDVVVHRYNGRGGEIYKLTLHVPTVDEPPSLEPWRTIITTPELRAEWDPSVTGAQLLELPFDQNTRICKINFALGWPANPRDAVTISRTFHDTSTVIDISTSLPRSPDEPAYLRPSPPSVRSHVSLFAWCIQNMPPSSGSQGSLRITCFWQHDLRALWNIGASSASVQQLSNMVVGLYKSVAKRSSRVPKLVGYGNGVTVERVKFQNDREALTVDYAIVPEDDESSDGEPQQHPLEDLQSVREHRRLTRTLEFVLPSTEGWDIQLTTRASTHEVESLPWSLQALRTSSTSGSTKHDQILLRVLHSELPDDQSLLKVRMIIEIAAPSSGLRLNGMPQTIQDVEERDPTSHILSQMLKDVSGNAHFSMHTKSSSFATTTSSSIAESQASGSNNFIRSPSVSAERSAAAEKSILSRVKRNYIYFSSLLQEPEAKWKRATEARGVTITQLDSIDPTLVVHRAEATFVGVGLWDLYGAVVSPGSRSFWDKTHEDARLLEHVNELSELWHFKTKAAWPVVGRDAVLLRTVYKSPTTIHVFSFSADDLHLFPNIPSVDPNTIRMQVDLQGWAIESLSPNTTSLTLLEQSDMKGWSNKTSTVPAMMVNALAGIGEFAIRCGGPPVVTRLQGAKATDVRYEHEKMNFRVEYEALQRTGGTGQGPVSSSPEIECEIRCDLDTWASSLDIVVDPPPASVSCLRRHKLSSDGGGLWLTISHDGVFVDEERLHVIVRRGPGKERGVVMLNGAKVDVDLDDLPEQEIKVLTKQKRVKPERIPLDQPPAASTIRRKRGEESEAGTPLGNPPPVNGSWVPTISSPLSRLFTYAVEQTTATSQLFVPVGSAPELSPSKSPIHFALDALAWTQDTHARNAWDNWTVISEKGIPVRQRLFTDISPVIPIHKGEKVIEGVSAEELAAVILEPDCRKQWDDRFESQQLFESFGGEARISFRVSKANFPFRDRGFFVATIMSRSRSSRKSMAAGGTVGSRTNGGDFSEHSIGTQNAIFCVEASFSPDSVRSYAKGKFNPYTLPVGRIFIDAWILETLDPYTKENYAVPSAKCTRLVAVDYAGSIPATVNAMINAALPKAILSVEAYVKKLTAPIPITRLPAAGLLVTERKDDETEEGEVCWTVRSRDESRKLAYSGFSEQQKVYRVVIVVKPTSTLRDPTPHSPGRGRMDSTPRPSSFIPRHSQSPGPDFPEDLSTPPMTTSPSPSFSAHARERTLSATSSPRGRPSAFTLKGEVRLPLDLLVGEVVVDSKLYPDGYTLSLNSRTRPKGSPVNLDTIFPREGHESAVLPLVYAIHTMLSSPLHSSGLDSEHPTRHLIRLTLPTAQFEVSTVRDPLTGETHTAPPKPVWLQELESGEGVVELVIRPNTTGSKGGVQVLINASSTSVAETARVYDEKESLTKLGRDELQDSRVSQMSLLSRTTNQSEVFPQELGAAIAISDSLVDSAVPSTLAETPIKQLGGVEDNTAKESAPGSPETPATALVIDAAPAPHAESAPSGGLLGLLNSYSKPFAESSNDMAQQLLRPIRAGPIPTVPVSTAIIMALIAFLFGSLLRSLLSPADFVYVVTDLQQVHEEHPGGWREMRRLFEVKYILAGWDFQIAAVRRH